MKVDISRLFLEHSGKQFDKWSSYLSVYQSILDPYKEKPVRLLEIGVQNGGSLEIWCQYFQNAIRIVGCDIDERCKQLTYSDPRVSIVIGDVNADPTEKAILETAESFSLIIDDGSHKSGDIIKTFVRYFPHLEADSLYIIEDLHASYWADFQGGLYDPFSALSFFKKLTDIINQEHWRNGLDSGEFLSVYFDHYEIQPTELDLSKIDRIDFFNSMVVIHSANTAPNQLGRRVVRGAEVCVGDSNLDSDDSLISDQIVRINDDKALDVVKLISKVELLEQKLIESDTKIAEDGEIIAQLSANIEELARELHNTKLELSEQIARLEAEKAQLAEEIS